MEFKNLETIKITLKDQKEVKNIKELCKLIEERISYPITTLLNVIMYGSIKLDASDIHFETLKDEVLLRLRVDGVLHDVLRFPIKVYEQLLSRIKLLSKMKLNIENKPQDGRFSVFLEGNDTLIEIRSSTLPSENGESVVMRILNPKNLKDISELGIREDLMDIFYRAVKEPTGLIITTGPTGSGKTTTLYAFLKSVKSPEVKIITIEDPIEYHLEGITQTQVSDHYSFADGLKSIMRQDPDVILVGEIRDEETAKIAVQASLTGHKVFSTVHANEAIGVISRLKTLGVKVSDLASALTMCIAQRLIRKACPYCAEKEKPNQELIKKIKENLENISPQVRVPDISSIFILKEKGCEKCNFTGFKGRVGIFEAFLLDDELREMIIIGESQVSIKRKLIQKGMTTLKQDAIIKMLQGKTTLSEVERVVGMI